MKNNDFLNEVRSIFGIEDSNECELLLKPTDVITLVNKAYKEGYKEGKSLALKDYIPTSWILLNGNPTYWAKDLVNEWLERHKDD